MAYGYCTAEPAGLLLPRNCPSIAPALPQGSPALSCIGFGQRPTGPIALLQITEQQDKVVGDGTTSLVPLAAELFSMVTAY